MPKNQHIQQSLSPECVKFTQTEELIKSLAQTGVLSYRPGLPEVRYMMILLPERRPVVRLHTNVQETICQLREHTGRAGYWENVGEAVSVTQTVRQDFHSN